MRSVDSMSFCPVFSAYGVCSAEGKVDLAVETPATTRLLDHLQLGKGTNCNKVCLSLPVCPRLCLCLSFVSVYRSLFVSPRLSVSDSVLACQSVCRSVCLSVFLSLCASISLFVCLSVFLSSSAQLNVE